ncbi:hypothetical protein FPQ18DRAFT_325416 [Pyronema domesticum]|nr:hypothetical protein FPQ18DRAFT_325416 [Pyronema domesticum]
MPRRKNLSKNIQLSDDGWAIIPGRNRAPMRLTLEDQLEKLSITATEADHARLDRELVKASGEIREEATLSSLRDAVRALKQITKRVLVLGLGSLVGATASSSMLQLAMVVEVLELLGRKEEIDVVFRDPAFTGVDVAFLEKHERWTVEDALKKHAKDLETTPTVLIAPHLDFDVLAAHLGSTHLPILLLSNDLQHYMDLRIGDAKEFDVFTKFYASQGDYVEKLLVVQDKGGSGIGRAFNDLGVYWRKDAVREDEVKNKSP